MGVQTSEVEESERTYDDRIVYEDGVEVILDGNIPAADRWQEYGNDRLYPRHAGSGYIDLQAGEVESIEMKDHGEGRYGVGGYSVEFDADSGKLALLAHPDETLFAPDATEDEIDDPVVKALIPTEVLA
jgi:hypothetical protein